MLGCCIFGRLGRPGRYGQSEGQLTPFYRKNLKGTSFMLLFLLVIPIPFVAIFLNFYFSIELILFWLLYSAPFGIAGISGIFLSKSDNIRHMRILVVIFTCFLIYCVLSMALSIVYLIASIYMMSNCSSSHGCPDRGMYFGLSGFLTAYYLFSTCIARRAMAFANMLRSLVADQSISNQFNNIYPAGDYSMQYPNRSGPNPSAPIVYTPALNPGNGDPALFAVYANPADNPAFYNPVHGGDIHCDNIHHYAHHHEANFDASQPLI